MSDSVAYKRIQIALHEGATTSCPVCPPKEKNDHQQGIREKGHHSNGVTQGVTSHRDICPCKLGGYTLRRRKGGVPGERLEVPATSLLLLQAAARAADSLLAAVVVGGWRAADSLLSDGLRANRPLSIVVASLKPH